MATQWKRLPLASVPELADWQQESATRDLLLENASGDLEHFLADVERIVEQDMPDAYQRRYASQALQKLAQRGYRNEELARAFGYAWLVGSDTLYLPNKGLNMIENPWITYGIPVAMVSASAVVAMELWIHFNPRAAGYFFYGYALLAIPAVPLGWMYYKLVNGLLKGIYRQTKDLDQRHPQRQEAEQVLDSVTMTAAQL